MLDPEPFTEVTNIQATVLDSLNGFVVVQNVVCHLESIAIVIKLIL